MTNPFPLLLAHTTCANLSAAERLAAALVEAHLAACVNIGSPSRSVYAWEGKLTTETEVALLIKTNARVLPALKDFLLEHHDYEVPELVITPVIDGNPAYLDWANEWLGHA